MMFKRPSIRLSFALALLTANLVLVAHLLGFIPDVSKSTLEMRKGLIESMALQFSAVAEKGEFQIMQNTLREVVKRNDDIRSAAIRTNEGRLVALAGEHLAHWRAPIDGKSTPTHIHVPIFRQGKQWATVEMRFAPLWKRGGVQGFIHSLPGLVLFISLASFLGFFLVIRRTLRELDPSSVIPDRVQTAFDVLKEGVMVMDEKEHIVMVNTSFAGQFGKTPERMIGLKGSELGWMGCSSARDIQQLPWIRVLREGHDKESAPLSLRNSFGQQVKYAVNVAMVTDNAGKCRGCLATFDDITQIEEKNFELNELVEKLQVSKDEIQGKSKELEFLANHDPLTMCLNRRALDRQLGKLFSQAQKQGTPLSCLMVDIDHFKSVNDRYGHAIGDQVIKRIADVLKSSTRDTDLVGRYGGEEFCLILPDLPLQKVGHIAERIRKGIEKKPCAGVSVTASFGISVLNSKINSSDELVNQADKALYVAKKSGRNQVVVWGAEYDKKSAQVEEKTEEAAAQPVASKGEGELQHRIRELEGMLEKRSLELEHYEMYDIKTGLPTRALFEDRVNREIVRSKRNDRLVVILSVSMETIKRVCETMGRRKAEQLLTACGERLQDVLRQNMDTVAMVDEDENMSSVSIMNQTEFAVLLPDVQRTDDITWVVKRVRDAFENPFTIDGRDLYTTPYLGVSIYPHDGQTAEDLYSSAAHASHYAQKVNSKDRYLYASSKLNEVAVKQLQVENSLHTAIQNDELELHYQPKVEARSLEVVGYEALLRWRSQQLGVVSPGDFIPVSEHTGQIERLGDWVFYHACQQIRRWLDIGIDVGSVAVNLSGVQLRQSNLAYKIQSVLEEFRLEPHRLEIELTESSLVNSYDKEFKVLQQIKAMGMQVTMDDFGTGYSSLAYLKDMPLSCLKIDRSFTVDLGKDANTKKLIGSIISMAQGLGLTVVAEGVEEQEQADHLIELGCEYLQGYLISKPMPASAIEDFFQKRRSV